MSPFNGSQGQPVSRPARAQAPEQGQASWAQPTQAQWGQSHQAPAHQVPAQQAPGGYDPNGFAQHGYGGQPGGAPAYGQSQDNQYAPYSHLQSPDARYAKAPGSSGHGQQFEPYAAAAAAAAAAPPPAPRAQAQPAYQAAPQQGYAPLQQGYNAADPRSQGHAASQWPAPAQHDPRGFDLGGYLPQQGTSAAQTASYRPEAQQFETEQAYGEWQQPQAAGSDLGFSQPVGGELDPAYGEEEQQDFEAEEPRRGRRPLMMAAILAGAIIAGGGMAYSYKAIFGKSSAGDPPVIKSAMEPSKIKPADAGGKQFSHADSKIMGRLGDGTAASSIATGEGPDAGGTRKVPTLVVGRDGSIQAPAPAEVQAQAEAPVQEAPPAQAAAAAPAVPGMMVVDALAGNKAPQAVRQSVDTVAAQQKLVVSPPAAVQKPVVVAKAVPQPASTQPAATGSIEQPAAATARKKKPQVVDALGAAPASVPAPAAGSVATTSGGNGFVAVLASVPRSDSSRLDALKRFADMQQKYGSVLGGKTPDVAEANLGAKGAYHRLVVGPPGSREQASAVCSQLKTQGYADCWVTSY